ncbi:MAG: hypothetical protein ABSB42_10200, partial [Tepidisphaeraceae bacterium]
IDACFVISPDMASLCGDLESVGNSAKVPGQVDGAHVVVSTHDLNRIIADVYVCRSDFYEANRELVSKFVYGYLKGCEDVDDLYKSHDDLKATKAQKDAYQKVLQLTQTIFGNDTIPTLEDAHGLLSDCDFANYNGNARFFNLGEANTIGFEVLNRKALNLALGQEYVTERFPLTKAEFNYDKAPFTSLRTYQKDTETPGPEIPIVVPSASAAAIFTFNIYFEPDQVDFSTKIYGKHFKRALEDANRAGACMVQIRGYSDPTKVILDTIQAGQKLNILQANRQLDGTFVYLLHGQPFDFGNTQMLIEAVKSGQFEKALDENNNPISPLQTLAATDVLSLNRAKQVKAALTEFAQNRGILFSESQFMVDGAGISNPEVPFPKTDDDASRNRRVEFRLLPVRGESAGPGR